jgi:hypothetical protein
LSTILLSKPGYYSTSVMTKDDDLDMINLCSQLKNVGIEVDISRISKNRHSKDRLDEIKGILQNLLQLLRSGSDYELQHYDDGKENVSGHKIESLYRCKECNQIFTTRTDASKHQTKTGHKGTVLSSRFS